MQGKFPKKTKGTVRMLIARGVRVAALGHANLLHGAPTVLQAPRVRIERAGGAGVYLTIFPAAVIASQLPPNSLNPT